MDSFIPLSLHAPLPKPHLDPATLSPHEHAQSPSPPSDPASQAEAVSMRRKKNADAQAAFRARRANYIASLEETVTSLEAVVLSLQDTCREVRNDAEDLRRENTRLQTSAECVKQAARERERQWREFWQSKQQVLGLDDLHLNELPPIPLIFQAAQVTARQCTEDASRYQNGVAPHHQLEQYVLPPAREIDQRYATPQQTYTTSSENTWPPLPFSNSRTPCLADPHPSQSSSSSDSPQSLSPNIHYLTRFPVTDEARVSLVNVNMQGTTYDSTTFAPFSPGGYQNPRNVSSDSERYAPRPRRSYSQSRPGDFYSTDVSRGENEGLNGEGGLDGLGRPHHGRLSSDSLHHGPPSLSPSSSPPLRDKELDREARISNTLAMIKAQAFGSLRRARTKPKKGAETASKVAVDILNARGIGMGVQQPSNTRLSSKRKSGQHDNIS